MSNATAIRSNRGDETISSRELLETPRIDQPPMKGSEMHALAAELFPICRSITGDGLRATLRRIREEVPITIHEVPSGTQVLDWSVPEEWNIRDAWIKDSRGERVVDFGKSNLQVVNYSMPLRAKLQMANLRSHLHSLPARPDSIPYRTSYYKRDWGFCLSHHALEQLADGEYDVCIDSTLAPGSLSYGELLLRGETNDEFLISCHCCHPSMANDNLSGVVMAVALAKALMRCRSLTHSFRFLFIPGTIGAITWLARNERNLSSIKHGLVLTCVGDAGNITYKKSRRGNAAIDLAVRETLREAGAPHRIIPFFPYGYDERQYCSPGFNLPVGCFMRSQHGTFPEYHTSADNLDFLKPEALADSLEKLLAIIDRLEEQPVEYTAPFELNRSLDTAYHVFPPPHQHRRFLNCKPKGEPQLGKYGIYEALGNDMMPALWLLNYSDGEHSISDIATRSGLSYDKLENAANVLIARGLLKEVEP